MPQDKQQPTSDIPDSSRVSRNTAGPFDNRHLVRQLIIQNLYERHTQSVNTTLGEASVVRELDIPEDLELNRVSTKTAKKLKKGFEKVQVEIEEIWGNISEIDQIIQKYAKSWPINQINPVDLQILRLGIYEGFISKKIPAKVAIDEAIELGKDFGTEGNIRFISGVLGNIYAEKPAKNG